MEFMDRLLTCTDCGGEFIFTAGEQLFFFDKQFKNDPKRCKPCKGKRAGLSVRSGPDTTAASLPRTETRTECSACGIETTVPFKPTQGRPVLCRQCFQLRPALAMVNRQPASVTPQNSAQLSTQISAKINAQINTATAGLLAAGSQAEHGTAAADLGTSQSRA